MRIIRTAEEICLHQNLEADVAHVQAEEENSKQKKQAAQKKLDYIKITLYIDI